jgi:hypothetical protein
MGSLPVPRPAGSTPAAGRLARLGDVTALPPGMPGRLRAAATGAAPFPPDEAGRAARLEAQADREAYAAMRARQSEFRRRAWAASCPVIYRSATVSGLLPQQDPEGAVSSWPARSGSLTLLLHGPSRHGKTWAAYAAGNEARAKDQWVAAYRVTDLLRCLRPSEQDPALPERTWSNATSCDLLVLDDLGRESGTAWTVEQLWGIIDARLAEARRTVVTTNLDASGLSSGYGEPVLYRLTETATVARIEGEVLTADPASWAGSGPGAPAP